MPDLALTLRIMKPTNHKTTHLSRKALVSTLGLIIACSTVITSLPVLAEDQTAKTRKAAGCKNCKLAQAENNSPKRTEDRDHPRPEQTEHKRAEHKGRPPHPPEARKPQDMPPEAQKFTERIRDFHQEIGKLYREGNQEAARETTNELRKFIQDHASLTRRISSQLHGPGSKLSSKTGFGGPHPRPGSPPVAGGNAVERRIQHLRQAAENLEQAGMHEESKNIHQHAENLARELHQNRRRDEGHAQAESIERIEQEMRELHAMVSRMKKEIEELKAKPKKKTSR